MSQTQKLSVREKIGFGLGDGAANSPCPDSGN
jgi:Na+/melibiose symporter-like transporter